MSTTQKEIFPITSSKLPGGLAATSPPPINLATKPCLSHKLLANNTENALCANRALIPVYVLPEHVDAVQEFILSLGQTLHKFPAPESAACEPFLQPEELNNPNLSDDDSLDSVELVSIFSQMSTSPSSSREHASACIPQPTPSAVGSSTSPRMSMNKYYCILIGKKTGVFWDQWANVEPYVKNVSGATHKSFRTHDLALDYYLDAKAKGRVRVVRNPGDDVIYGSRSDAMQ